MKWFYVIATVVVAGFALLPLTYLRGQSDDAYAGRVVRYNTYGAEVKSIDPATCGDTTSSAIQGNFYEGLYSYHYLKRPIEVIPQLADGMPEISQDGLTYTVKLKKGVKYSRNPCFGTSPDGTFKTRTVRADDFVLAFKRIADYHVNTGLAWAFLSERVAGLDEWRGKVQGVPARQKAAFSRLDQWRQTATDPARLPAAVRAELKVIDKWRAKLRPEPDVKQAFDRLARWAKEAERRPASIADIAAALEKLDHWRTTMVGYRAGDFSRYDLPVDGIKALDEHTLQIKLRQQFPQLIYCLAMHVYAPVPREAVDYWLASEDDGHGSRRAVPVKKRGTEFREPEQVASTGPYLLKRFVRKWRIVLERNPDFRDDFYPAEGSPGDREAGLLDDAGKRVPFVDVLHFDFVPEDSTAWLLFKNKRSDSSGIPKEVFEFVITPEKSLTDAWSDQGIRLVKYEPPVVYWLVFNMEDPVVGASRSLRQALCLAYDVENHIKILHNGRGRRAVNILPSSFKGHKETGPGPYSRLDLVAAREKLVEAKKELAAAGKLEDGQIPQLTLDLPGRDRAAYRMGEFVQQQFKKLGVELKVIGNDWPTLQEKVHNKRCQIYTMGWQADYPDAENFLQLFYSPNIAKQTNNSNYSNPAFDKLYEKARIMQDTRQRTELYAKMARMVSEDCPVLLLSEPFSFVLVYDWVGSTKRHPIGGGFAKYTRIDPARRQKMGGR